VIFLQGRHLVKVPVFFCGSGVMNNELNRKNGFAEGKIGAKVALPQRHGEQLL